MTAVALGAGADMGRRLGLRILGNENATVTRRALARHAGMVHRGGRPVDETAHVASIALCRGRDVRVGFRLRIGESVGTIMAA